MLLAINHTITNIQPSFQSRYSHDLAKVLLSLTGEKVEVYKEDHVDILKKSITNSYNLPYNNRIITEAAITLLGHKAKKFSPSPDHDGTSPDTGFDCSGFICYILDILKLHRPQDIRFVRNFFWSDYGTHIESKILPGDLVFFSWGGDKTNHIGVYLGNIEGEDYYIHASNAWGKVILSKVNAGIITRDTTKKFQKNPIGFKRI